MLLMNGSVDYRSQADYMQPGLLVSWGLQKPEMQRPSHPEVLCHMHQPRETTQSIKHNASPQACAAQSQVYSRLEMQVRGRRGRIQAA